MTMRSVYALPDAQLRDVHLRSLTIRAEPTDRYSALSQFSDSPSTYSRGYHIPGNADRVDAQSLSNEYYSRDNLERFQDRHTSTLDFSDDRSSHTSTSEPYDDDDTHSFEDPCDEETSDRMSYLGPKMRFHSLAPWEMEADALEEEEEPTESPKTSVFPFSFVGYKGASSASSSPRPSHSTSRPSEDSFKKRSFETINSQFSSKGALYALAQESLSATSLAKPVLSKFSRARTPVNQTTPTPPSPPTPTSPLRSPRNKRYQPPPPLMKTHEPHHIHETYDAQRSGFPSSDYSADESIHPYANPDLIPPQPVTAPPVSPMSIHCPRGQQEPYGTHRESSYQVQLAPKPVSNPPLSPLSTQFPRGPFGASEPWTKQNDSPFGAPGPLKARESRASSIHGKGISSPIAVQGSGLPVSLSNESANIGSALPGWTERIVPPSFSLISLEEARAQQGKNLTTSDNLARTLSSNTTISTTGQTHEDLGASTSCAMSVRSRGRTISAGAKAKNAIQSMVGSVKSDRRDSEPAVAASNVSQSAGKTLKHKKSGFMRLFNKDKEEEVPPPVPQLAPVTSWDDELSWKRTAVPRIPVRDHATQDRPLSAVPKHSPPNLSINTQNGSNETASTTAVNPMEATLNVKPWSNSDQPKSAPADVSTFPALRLRPVSTLFSAHFEHFVPELQSNANECIQVETPTSSSPPERISPITPGPTDLFSKGGFDSQSTIIKSLHEELATSKATSERRIRDLESQIKDLKLEVEELRSNRGNRNSSYCENCSQTTGYLSSSPNPRAGSSPLSAGSTHGPGRSVLNRPRAKTGSGSRFVNADS